MRTNLRYSISETIFFIYFLLEHKGNKINDDIFKVFSNNVTVIIISQLLKEGYLIEATLLIADKEISLSINDSIDNILDITNTINSTYSFEFQYTLHKDTNIKQITKMVNSWNNGKPYSMPEYPYKKFSLQKREIADIFLKLQNNIHGEQYFYTYKPEKKTDLDILILLLYFHLEGYIIITNIIFRDGLTFKFELTNKFQSKYNITKVGNHEIIFNKNTLFVTSPNSKLQLMLKFKNHLFIIILLGHNGKTVSYDDIQVGFKDNNMEKKLTGVNRFSVKEAINDIYDKLNTSKRLFFLYEKIEKIPNQGYKIKI